MQVVQAYRVLYKQALVAVNYASPSRFVVRDHLREGFRKGHKSNYDSARVQNTIQFLRGAAFPHTLEHKVLQTLVHTWWWRRNQARLKYQPTKMASKTGISDEVFIRNMAHDQFDHMVRMLNESMGMCIR